MHISFFLSYGRDSVARFNIYVIMKFIAYRNIINNSDSLCITHSIINDIAELLTLVNNWLVDRGCDDKYLLDRVGRALGDIYKGRYDMSESNHELFNVIIHNNTLDKIYLIEFKYTTIGELGYKEQEKIVK